MGVLLAASAASFAFAQAGSVSGRWHWQANRQESFYQGDFEIGPVTDARFNGQFFSDLAGPIPLGD